MQYVSRFRDKDNFTDVVLDELAPVLDTAAMDNEVWCLELTDDGEIERLKAFVLAVWTFTVTSLSACRGKHLLEPKTQSGQRDPDEEEHEMLARSQGCTGAAEEDVVAKRLVAMKSKFRIEGDRRLYTAKPGTEPIDVSSAPLMACKAYKNAGRGVKHHWFHECLGFD